MMIKVAQKVATFLFVRRDHPCLEFLGCKLRNRAAYLSHTAVVIVDSTPNPDP